MAGDMGSNEAPKLSEVFSFDCAQCGSPIQVLAPGQSLTFVCRSCSAIVQEDARGKRVLVQASQASVYKPLFELGAKVEFRGDRWQIIGFMVRCDDEEEYFWREYLLFNPYLGYRFLMEADGHWNFLHTTKHLPTGTDNTRVWMGKRYRCFHRGKARVKYVLGEFYWAVKSGDESHVQDYIAPPDILSCEISDNEIVWSSGKYVPADDIQKSFQIFGLMPKPIGVAPNEPSLFIKQRNRVLLHWLGFTLAIFVLQLILGSGDKKTLMNSVVIRPASKVDTIRTQSFVIDKDEANLEISLSAPLSNTWLEVAGTVVPEDNQTQAFSFKRDLAQYNDDGDGRVDKTREDLFFPKLPRGRYHIEFTLDSNPAVVPYGLDANSPEALNSRQWPKGTNDLRVMAVQDPPLATPLTICLLLIAFYPFIYLLRDLSFENSRWSSSNQS